MSVQLVKPMPPAPSLTKLLGPSFIMLALGLGSGEVILWPYLAANYGLGIAWGAVLGIGLQFLINMEIERYALVKGESVFVGLSARYPWTTWWFMGSTFLGFALPGIIGASAQVFASLIGITQYRPLAAVLLVVIGLILSVGRHVYTLVEGLTRIIIFCGLPFLIVLTFVVARHTDWAALAWGLAGRGEGYWFFPSGMSIATFFGAFAYSGAAGNLNLAQSVYVKEKGYGMGRYAEKIAGLFSGLKKPQFIRLAGETMADTPSEVNMFKQWWRKINTEHGFVFFFLGAWAMALLMLLAYATAYGAPSNREGIHFVITEGATLAERIGPWVGVSFLAVVGVMLFQTQLGVLDSTSRIIAENIALQHLKRKEQGYFNLSRWYAIVVWLQIAVGSALLLFTTADPKSLIVLGAVANAFAMFVHIALVSVLNYRTLPASVQPALWRRVGLGLAFLIFGVFSAVTLVDAFKKLFV